MPKDNHEELDELIESVAGDGPSMSSPGDMESRERERNGEVSSSDIEREAALEETEALEEVNLEDAPEDDGFDISDLATDAVADQRRFFPQPEDDAPTEVFEPVTNSQPLGYSETSSPSEAPTEVFEQQGWNQTPIDSGITGGDLDDLDNLDDEGDIPEDIEKEIETDSDAQNAETKKKNMIIGGLTGVAMFIAVISGIVWYNSNEDAKTADQTIASIQGENEDLAAKSAADAKTAEEQKLAAQAASDASKKQQQEAVEAQKRADEETAKRIDAENSRKAAEKAAQDAQRQAEEAQKAAEKVAAQAEADRKKAEQEAAKKAEEDAKYAVIPDVIGMDREEAEAELRDAGFTNLDWRLKVDSDGEELVSRIEPGKGKKVDKTTRIALR